jgi:calmodulin
MLHNQFLFQANTLDLEQINEFRQAFNMFDINGKGVIAIKQLKTVMASLGQNLNKKHLNAMVRLVCLFF